MTNLITEARELCEKATPGEWKANHLDDCFIEPRICEIPANGCYDYKMVEANSMFIARSRTLISELCDALEKAQAEVERLREHLDNRCDSCACEIANERDKALARLEAEVRTSLHEAQERDKGCDHCNLIYKMDGASYGTTDEIIDNKFCPMCGKRLEVEPC